MLSFVSDPLTEDLTILGRIQAELFVKSDADDTAFTVRLMQVLPDGKAVFLRSSIVTLAFSEPYTPGETRCLTLSLWDIAYQLHKGDRLRVDLSSSDFPQYAVHPTKEGAWSLHEKTAVARQTIYTGEKYPSALILPIVK